MPLAQRTILLTGAGGGIGGAVATRLAAAGARLLLVSRSPAKLAALHAMLPSRPSHQTLAADIATAAGRAALRSMLAGNGRPLHALVNAAGVSRFGWLAQMPPGEVEAQLATNITAPILLAQLALPFLDPQHGRILNIGSVFGGIGHPGFSAYCASKFALRGFTEALRRELADGAIQVAYLAPRATRTPMNSPAVNEMNAALGIAMDPPERVAAQVERMLRARRMRDAAIGWPERLFLRINAVCPWLVDAALRRQLGAVKRHATPTSLPAGEPSCETPC
jgi:short-subunit dehydrogenase